MLSDGCSPNYYSDPTTRKCVLECNDTVYIYKDNSTMQCVDQCPFGLFADHSDMTAKKCVLTCPNQWF